MPDTSTGKVSSGSRFQPPPATIWNNMIAAGQAIADGQFSSIAGPPTRPRDTDIIKIRNDSGALRRKGEILKIEGNALEDVVAEHIWLLGVEPTTACYFGILREPADEDIVAPLQVSGCCVALVDITDAAHKFARVVAGEYVLKSGSSGPIEILFSPEAETGEQSCVVRFNGGGGPIWAVNIGSLGPATHPLTGNTTGVAGLFTDDGDDLEISDGRTSFIRRDGSGTIDDGTLIQLDIVSGKLTIVWADCAAHEDLTGLEAEP